MANVNVECQRRMSMSNVNDECECRNVSDECQCRMSMMSVNGLGGSTKRNPGRGLCLVGVGDSTKYVSLTRLVGEPQKIYCRNMRLVQFGCSWSSEDACSSRV